MVTSKFDELEEIFYGRFFYFIKESSVFVLFPNGIGGGGGLLVIEQKMDAAKTTSIFLIT
ncbi:hypothetical protein ACTFQF_13115 [Aliivibrio fischeri]|uniref:hypothetical protein n=1 Tax=Aliivibrio fischeri TaxID=668 RepID=UPI0007C538B7|nr:hypothetical protein [Aliivibrio fischeri]MBP3142051.1 hypothetical protein [Aliivibrio fischeri]MBP3157319.1 hypothetical protein [Aliivibrio fischeri]